ncbi:uncharacterized protein BcabD6B2_52160 [Babesia caballi]|uniref:Uncharacterized protein n=1 Tax=Babesia caballi TaxID=5871 RepID=A0AAV4M114_BABCB|nr:hypothetical protein, conserved [Babesia caballi]
MKFAATSGYPLFGIRSLVHPASTAPLSLNSGLEARPLPPTGWRSSVAMCGGGKRTTKRNTVVNNNNPGALLNGILLDVQVGGTVRIGGVGADDRTRELARLPDNDQTAAKLVGQRCTEEDTTELQGGNVVDTFRVPLLDTLGHNLDGLAELVAILKQGHDVNKPNSGLEVSENPEVLLGELEGLGDHAAGDEEEESHNVHHFGCRRL